MIIEALAGVVLALALLAAVRGALLGIAAGFVRWA